MDKTTRRASPDLAELKRAAAGRWVEILATVAGIPADVLDGNHHPCPTCGGVDRFRLMSAETGRVICDHCNPNLKRGDGIDAVKWHRGCNLPESLKLVGDFLGVGPWNGKRPAPVMVRDALDAVAAAKGGSAGQLVAYGAKSADGVVVVPMFGADGKECSTFTINPAARKGSKAAKGLNAKGKPAGVFLPVGEAGAAVLPAPGETWLVVEGVKDAAAARGLGLLALGLSGSGNHPKWLPGLLRGCNAVLCFDRDVAGKAGAQLLGRKLVDHAESVLVVALPGEFVDEGGPDLRDALRLQGEEAVRDAIGAARPWAYEDLPKPTGKSPAAGKPVGQLTNATSRQTEDGQIQTDPRLLREILAEIRERTDDWPRRVNRGLFVDTGDGVAWLEDVGGVFGWLQTQTGIVRWRQGVGCANKLETVRELQRVCREYVAVEEVPHVPELPGHYYACPTPAAGSGEALTGLLDRFCPATDADRDLIQAALMTCVWGSSVGRPAFVITADTGRGAGKSKLVQMIGDVFGGCIAFAQEETIDRIKTRLMTPSAYPRRVALMDNVKSARFSWGALESLVTESHINGHQMYHGDARRPNTLTWFITLNGASLSTDMAQRAVIIKVRQPKRSRIWEDETRLFIARNRPAILGDLVGALQAESVAIDDLSRWSGWEGAVLERVPEPGEAQKVIAERRGAVDVEEEEGRLIIDHIESELRRLGYLPSSEKVFIPSRVLHQWLTVGLGKRDLTVHGAGRYVKQLMDEGRLPELLWPQRKDWGRGVIWFPMGTTGADSTAMDLLDRLERG